MADKFVVDAFIEIPTGSQNKYEWDKDAGVLRLDRVLYSSVFYPTDYGFIPETLEDDGDALDIMVLVTNPVVPGCVIDSRVVGMLEMEDDKGIDMKILAVPVKDPRFSHVKDLQDVAPHIRREIEYFFQTYKDLEGKKTIIGGWKGAAEALERIAAARVKYQQALVK